MNKIETLIKELCPNGVEWNSINNYTRSITSPKKLQKNQYEMSGQIPIIDQGATFIAGFSNINEYLPHGEYVIFGDHSEHIKFVNFPFVQGADGLKILVCNKNIKPKYLYYCFSNFYKKEKNYKRHWSKAKETLIPVPPLEIQEEIVKILDKFTDYVTELTTELTLRQKQYNYYRDKLLSFKDSEFEVQRKRIGDILVKGKGTKITASQMRLLHKDGSPIRVFAGGKTFADVDYGEIPEKDIHKETAIIVKSRGIIDFEYYSKPFTFKNEFWSYTSNDNNINLRYIYHYLIYNQNHFQEIANKMQMPQISSSDTENFIVPIPKIEIQSRIVQVLDNFDAVCNDLNIGLPKEIELRQKQYEFFRDKLLTFAAEGVYTDSTVQYRQDIIRLLQWVFGPIKVKLGSICDLDRGKRVVKSQLDQHDGYPVFQNSLTPLGYYEKNNRQAMTTFIVCAGAAAEVGYSTIPFWAADDIFTINNSENVVSKYIYHILLHQQDMLKSKVRKASIPRLSRLSIENIQFILPNLNTQIEIVNKLDQFDAICFDLSHGLPKEIELRQKQYEYYRDKLLSFD